MKTNTENSIMSGMQDMMHQMEAMGMTGNADEDFAMMMKIHQEGAITMAQHELDQGRDEDLKRMAKKMIEDQRQEVKALESWLSKNAKHH
jgi:uncharacterized protein (DUF305 family)